MPGALAGHRLAQGCPGPVHLLAQAVPEVQELTAKGVDLHGHFVASASNLHLVGLHLLFQTLAPVLQLLRCSVNC